MGHEQSSGSIRNGKCGEMGVVLFSWWVMESCREGEVWIQEVKLCWLCYRISSSSGSNISLEAMIFNLYCLYFFKSEGNLFILRLVPKLCLRIVSYFNLYKPRPHPQHHQVITWQFLTHYSMSVDKISWNLYCWNCGYHISDFNWFTQQIF